MKELAKPFSMGFPAFLKHRRVLEDSGLISKQKADHVRTCRIRIEGLAEAEAWPSWQHELWPNDHLASYVETHLSGIGTDD